jgi:hypothetical protein
MGNRIRPVLFFALGLLARSQELQHQTGVVNIEVPVRVFDGERFVDGLMLKDFEIFEDGVAQKIEAAYFIRKTMVERQEEVTSFQPAIARHFYLFFELYEPQPKIVEAVRRFLFEVLAPVDDLVVVTPLKNYHLRPEALASRDRQKIADQLSGLIRKDIMTGNMEYRATLENLKQIAARIPGLLFRSVAGAEESNALYKNVYFQDRELSTSEGDVEQVLEEYRIQCERLASLRRIDEQKLLSFARILKEREGQKFVFFMYQRESIPVPDKKLMLTAQDLWQDRPDIQMSLQELFSFNARGVLLNTDLVKRTFSDSSIAIHFLFLTSPAQNVPSGIQMEEHSEDVFSPLMEMAAATGGYAGSSSNPSYLMKKAETASENYYLLYYAPTNTALDGAFRNIRVAVKGRGYRVLHRAGYYAK